MSTKLKQLLWCLLVLALSAVPLMAGGNDPKTAKEMEWTRPKRPLCRGVRARRRA